MIGICTSISTTSYASFSSAATASTPLTAIAISQLHRSSMRVTTLRFSALSSASSTRMPTRQP